MAWARFACFCPQLEVGLASEGQPWVQEAGSPDHIPPQVIDYKGARGLETFSKFLDSGGELPTEEPAEVAGAAFPVGVCPQAPGLRPVLWRVAVGGHGWGWVEGVASSWVSVTPSRRSQETPRSPGMSCSCLLSAPTQELIRGRESSRVNKELWSLSVCGS